MEIYNQDLSSSFSIFRWEMLKMSSSRLTHRQQQSDSSGLAGTQSVWKTDFPVHLLFISKMNLGYV